MRFSEIIVVVKEMLYGGCPFISFHDCVLVFVCEMKMNKRCTKVVMETYKLVVI